MSHETNEVGQVMQQLFPAIDAGVRQGYREAWSMGAQLIHSYWLYILLGIIAFYGVAGYELKQGRWGMMGRVLYRTLYLGVLVLYGLLIGPEHFGNEYAHIAGAVLLYPACYYLVGVVLRWLSSGKYGFRIG